MRILFFDTETTGKAININASLGDFSNWPRVVQLAWQVYDENQNLLEEQCFIIKPCGYLIPNEAIAIHNISNEKAKKSGVDLKEVLNHFYSSVSTADLLIAHNFSFDYGVMGSELLRNGFANILDSKDFLCTMKSTIEFCKINGFNDYKWPKLQELYYKLFKDTFDEHNALEDIRATSKCFWELKSRNIILFDFKLTQKAKVRNIQQIEWKMAAILSLMNFKKYYNISYVCNTVEYSKNNGIYKGGYFVEFWGENSNKKIKAWFNQEAEKDIQVGLLIEKGFFEPYLIIVLENSNNEELLKLVLKESIKINSKGLVNFNTDYKHLEKLYGSEWAKNAMTIDEKQDSFLGIDAEFELYDNGPNDF